MTATTDPARTERANTTGTTRSPALNPPAPHNGEQKRGTPCTASVGSSGHAQHLLDLARRAEQARAHQPAAAPVTPVKAAGTPPGHAAPAPPPTHAVYSAAADHLLAHGWCQGMASDLTGSCLEHAVFLAGYTLGASTEALDALVGAIDAKLGMPARDWNDAPGRTPGEVVTLLRACADEARTAPTRPESTP